MGQILTFTTTKVKPHWICAKTHKLPTWLNNLRGILQGNPAFSMSLSFSFAHHKSIYQCFFSFYFHCFPVFLTLLTSPLTFLPSSSPFSLLPSFLSFPLPSYNPTFFSPFCASPSDLISSPPLPLPPFYLASFSNPFPSSYPLTHLPLCFPGSSLTPYTKSELLTGLKL